MKLFFVVLVGAGCVCRGNAVAAERATKQKEVSEVKVHKIGTARYVIGGILGTTLGLGIGHAVQGRWRNDYGWAFTLGPIATLLGYMLGGNCGVPGGDEERQLFPNENYDECVARRKRREQPWIIGFWLVRAAEIVSVWWPRNLSFTSSDLTPAAPNLTDISEKDYALGGILGTIIGFGSGHAVQGRWRQDGQIYTYTQLAGLAATAYSLFCSFRSSSGPRRIDEPPRRSYPLCDSFLIMMGLGGATLLISRIAEVASVWGPSVFRYRVVTARAKLPLSVVPLLNSRQAGLQLAWAF